MEEDFSNNVGSWLPARVQFCQTRLEKWWDGANRFSYFNYDPWVARPLTRNPIENLIHVKENTSVCTYSGKTSVMSNKTLWLACFGKPFTLQFDGNVDVCKDQTWMAGLVTFRAQVSESTHTSTLSCSFPLSLLVSDVKSKHKKRQCSRERGGGDWLDTVMSSLSGVIFSLQREEGGTHTKRKSAKCASWPYKGTAKLNDTGDCPGEDADGSLKRLQLETLCGGDEIPAACRPSPGHSDTAAFLLWTEDCKTGAAIKGRLKV